jgi:hypothetical protein
VDLIPRTFLALLTAPLKASLISVSSATQSSLL